MTESTMISLSTTKPLYDATLIPAGELDKERWQDIMGHERGSRPNSDEGNQTQIDILNGESYTLDINLPQPLLSPPSLVDRREYFHVTQKWEGYVIEVRQDVFLARLIPIKGEGSELEAEIYLEDVELPDHALVEPGAVFYWSIGYFIKPSRNRIKASQIRFQLLPPRTKGELEKARARAAKLINLFDDG
jgi:hypothetical protein